LEVTLPSSVNADPVTTSGASIIRRLSRGFGALSLGAVVQLLSQVSIVPVALYSWGKVRYGEWVLLTGFVTFLKLTDLGLQSFVVNRLCASFARGDRDGMQHDLHSALRVQLPLVLLVASICATIVFNAEVDHALNLQTISGLRVSLAVILLTTELLIAVPMGVIGGLYRATGRLA